MTRHARHCIAALALAATLPSISSAAPDSAFAQAGQWRHVRSLTVGATWDWKWQHESRSLLLTAYTEVALARWQTHGTEDDRGYTRFGVTPVLRVYPKALGGDWFGELGIGANVIAPLFSNGGDRFSTTFNFGDHVAIGRRFGERGEHELAVRFEHFSNAGLKRPNPGQNFMQLRYAYRF